VPGAERDELADVGLDPVRVDRAEDRAELGIRRLRTVRPAGAGRPVLARIEAAGVRGGGEADQGCPGSGRGAGQEGPARGMRVFPRVVEHPSI
jgi:hypothetical protein